MKALQVGHGELTDQVLATLQGSDQAENKPEEVLISSSKKEVDFILNPSSKENDGELIPKLNLNTSKNTESIIRDF